jgi:hypothetical protein
MNAPAAPQDAGTAALTFINTACGFDFTRLTAEEKRLKFKTLRAAIIQWQMRIRAAEFPVGNHFMQYNSACFLSEQEFSEAFPAAPEPLPPPPPPFYPANPTTQLVNIYTQEKALATAYTLCLDDLKYILERLFAPDIAHLAHELTLFANVSPSAMYAAGHAAHGRLIPSDLASLRAATKSPVDRTLTPEENLVLFEKRHKTLADIGPAHAVNDGEKLSECTNFISSMAPATKTIVERYYADVDMNLRTTSGLLTYTRDALARLPSQPDLSQIRHALVAQSHTFTDEIPDPEPTAFAAAASQPPKSKGAKQGTDLTQAELIAFYDDAPVARYCFTHGFGHHSTEKCFLLRRGQKLTADQIALKRPIIKHGQPLPIDGKFPSVAVLPGFKMPN